MASSFIDLDDAARESMRQIGSALFVLKNRNLDSEMLQVLSDCVDGLSELKADFQTIASKSQNS